MPGSGETMPKRGRQIQRNCLCFAEAADAEPAQRRDMTERAERQSEVADERADIGALADSRDELSVIAVGQSGEFEFKYRDQALGERRCLAGASERIGALASHF